MKELELKYGCNPNQKPSRIYMNDGSELPKMCIRDSPRIIHAEYTLSRTSVCDRNLFSALIADDLIYLFCFFQLILAHTISSCKNSFSFLSSLKYIGSAGRFIVETAAAAIG